MKTRLLILTEIISPYRIPVFNALTARDDVDLHVVFLAETDPTQRQWVVHKEEIRFSYEVLPSWRRRWGKYHCLLNRGVAPALDRFDPQVIICGGYNYPASWSALQWARRKKVPFLLWVESTARDLRSGHGLVERLKSAFMERCRGFVVPGKSSSEYLLSYGVGKESIFVAPNAVDTDFFARAAAEAGQDHMAQRDVPNFPSDFFLFAGRMVPAKGVFDLLDAYAHLTPELRTRWGLVFVGDGPALAELRARAARLLPGSVYFAGFAQREELAKYYGQAGVFVLPTHSDPWGLVVNEAMAAGLPPVVSSAAGCAADLVREGWNGHLFPPGNTRYLASVLQQLAEDQKRRRQMGERSRELIQNYSPRACADGMATAALACAGIR